MTKCLILYPHQERAINFALARPVAYLALDPGLGKTIVAALLKARRGCAVIYICPPFLATNTKAEFEKWSSTDELFVFSDSMLSQSLAEIKTLSAKYPEALLIVDEAHRFKNYLRKSTDSDRARVLFEKILPLFDNVVFMSGSPMPNSRPMELWPFIRYGAHPDFSGMSYFNFGLKFCAGRKDFFGWKFDGFTNKQEFCKRLFNNFMLRQKKELLNLPPKIEGLLTVGEDLAPVVSKIEREVLKRYSPEDLVKGELVAIHGAKVAEFLPTYLRHLGGFKLKYALPYIENLLEDTKENILVFAVHRAVISQLASALETYAPLVITGDTPKEDRQDLVNEYQTNPARRLFIGNIQSCGVGFTLTKATRVLFLEFSWVDGDNVQASDRAHRIGQGQSVLVQYVVLKNSFDRTRMEVLLKKRNNAL